MFIHDVCKVLEEAKVPHAVVGGLAVALHGVPRGTLDVDIAINWTLNNLKKAEAALLGMGLVSRIPVSAEEVFHFRDEYIKNRNLIAWNFYDRSNQAKQVDIIINYDLSKSHVKKFKTSGGVIGVLALEDLIAMKKSAGRVQDLEDVKSLENL